MIQPRSCSILSSYSLPDTQALERALREEVEKNRRKIVVLDDDPTGVQTVHDIYVYTDWTLDSLRRADGSRLAEGDQHVDLRVGAQHSQRVRAGTGGVGVC